MKNRLFLPVAALVIAVLACNLPNARTPASDAATPNQISTLIAEKLTQAALTNQPAPVVDTPVPATPPATLLRVVYAKSGNIFLWDEGSGARQLTFSGEDRDAIISSDGQVIVFRRGTELWLIGADGSNERLLISVAYLASFASADGSAVRVASFLFAPGSHFIFFDTLIETEVFPLPQYDLHRVDTDQGIPGPVLKAGQGGEVTFSPDGRWIALVGSESINLIQPDGAGLRKLFGFSLVSTYSEWFYRPQVVWKSDSQGFYTVIPASQALENPKELTRFWYVPLNGEPARLAEFVAVPVWIAFPRISPDGVRVLYLKPSAPNAELHVIDASTTDMLFTYYAVDKFGLGDWAPDSKHFYFWIEDARAHWLGALGQPAVPLTDTNLSESIRWIGADRLLYKYDNQLRVQALGQVSIVIDTLAASDTFDFALIEK
jgi:hypothetical protein